MNNSGHGDRAGLWPSIRRLSARDVQSYQACEDLTEGIISFMVVFSPWAFGTTQPWSVWTMNVAGYVVGAMLAVKLAIRRFKSYRAPRWGDVAAGVPPAVEGGILP